MTASRRRPIPVTVALGLAACALVSLISACVPTGSQKASGRPLPRTKSGFPKRPLTIMAPSNPGGGWDQMARLVQHILASEGIVSVPIEVVNRGGAGGTIGLADLATRYRRDPHTMMIGGGVMLGAILTHHSPFGLEDTVPLARLVNDYEVVAVPAASPYGDLGELMADFKRRPREIAWGGGSAGGTDHMTVGLLAHAAGVAPADVNYVAFTGGGEAAAAVMGGQVAAGVSGYSEWKGLAEGGRVRLLGVSAPHAIAGVPPIRDAGYDVVLANWRGVMAPPDVDPDARAWLIEALRRLRETPVWAETVRRNAWEDAFLPGDAFAAFLKDEQARTAQILSGLGLGTGGSGYAAMGPWAFPALVGFGLLLSASVIVWNGRAPSGRADAAPGETLAATARRWGPTMALLLAYVGLLEPIGFVVATAAYIFVQARLLGSLAWRRDLVASVALSSVTYFVFKRLLQIALPAGILG
jgi:putative tricarboxylic transport membrane protein